MYDYRNMSPEQRQYVLQLRRTRRYPWHGPPHLGNETGYRLVSAACYEHRCLLGSPERLAWFQAELLDALQAAGVACTAWCVLPNHYHALLHVTNVKAVTALLGRVHGRTSRRMNIADRTVGRRVWYRCQDRYMRSERHYHTSVNYIHHNPVRHGWVKTWQQWPCSSAHWYLEHLGREKVVDAWREYPLKDYGARWDAFPGPAEAGTTNRKPADDARTGGS